MKHAARATVLLTTFLSIAPLVFSREISLSDFRLVNQDGRLIPLSDFQQKTIFLSFIYTRCPMPGMCPLQTNKMVGIQKMVNQTSQDDVVFLTVTFDPEYDTPKVLREYAGRYGADLSNWYFLTGDKAEIDRLIQQVDLTYEKLSDGMIGHNMKSVIIARDGSVQQIFHGSGWEVDKIYQMIVSLTKH